MGNDKELKQESIKELVDMVDNPGDRIWYIFSNKNFRGRNFAGKKSGLQLVFEPDIEQYKLSYYRPGDKERMAATGKTLKECLDNFAKKFMDD